MSSILDVIIVMLMIIISNVGIILKGMMLSFVFMDVLFIIIII